MNKQTKMEVIGTKKFGPKIDITDPCYDKNTWCRKNNVEIKQGEYTCAVWMATEPLTWDGETYDNTLVAVIGIYLNGEIPAENDMEKIGTIGVDAGLAGFFENKPDYTDDKWDNICQTAREGKAWIIEEGFFSQSGYGDGTYSVFAHKNENIDAYTAVEIRFFDTDDNNNDDE